MHLSDPSLLRCQAYVGGTWMDADDGRRFDVLDPATGAVIGSVPRMGGAEIARAITAAAAALPAWAGLTAKDRAARLRRWNDLILAATETLAQLLCAEQGKPLAEARGEVAYGASFVEWFAEEAKRVYGDIIPAPVTGRRQMVLKQPIGVVAAITPWNFPIAMITRKCGPALAAGCTMVIKPAEDTPLSALALARLAELAGIPAGVLNVVTGDPVAIGAELTANPLVRKMSFTGSTPVGKLLMRQCADTVKKVSLELGGNAPFLVFDDADLDAAIAGAMASKYRNAGQTCICTNRILVQDGIHDAFVRRLTQAVTALRVGVGTEPGVTTGPLINARARDKVVALVADAVKHGATLRCGGQPIDGPGHFFAPTVLNDVTPDMAISQQEIFGPVATVTRFDSEAEAVRLANDTPFGLAAYAYTRDLGRAWRLAEALEYGIVGINEGLVSTEVAPFGGFKESGIGREGSKYGIDEYLELKSVCLGGLA